MLPGHSSTTGSLDPLVYLLKPRSRAAGAPMTRFFKSAAFPIIIVIVLAFFASKLISGNDRAEKTPSSQFPTQIDSKPSQVKSVTLDTKDNSVEVTKTDGKKYEVGYPAD